MRSGAILLGIVLAGLAGLGAAGPAVAEDTAAVAAARDALAAAIGRKPTLTTSYLGAPGRWVAYRATGVTAEGLCEMTIHAEPSKYGPGEGSVVRAPFSPEQSARFEVIANLAEEPPPPFRIDWGRASFAHGLSYSQIYDTNSSAPGVSWFALFFDDKTVAFAGTWAEDAEAARNAQILVDYCSRGAGDF